MKLPACLPFNALVLLDPRHHDIYEAEVIVAVSTIKSDSVYGKVRAQL